MTVTIKNVGNGAGWGDYVIHDRTGATTILGDAELGDKICKEISHYKSGNSVNFVISFASEDNVTQEQGRKIAKLFMREYMKGFDEDEYHLDMVEHTNTNHLHYHARIPKLNLLTGTQLKLYWHKTDLSYKKAVIDKICHDYDLVTGQEMKNTVPNPLHKLNQINKWRKEHGQKLLDLSGKKSRAMAEQAIREYLEPLISRRLINSRDEVKQELNIIGLEIVKEGFDKGKEFHYLTIHNESGKMRIKGDYYGKNFWGDSGKDRAKAIINNRSVTARDAKLGKSGTDVKQALQAERRKRSKRIDIQYRGARKRARTEFENKHRAECKRVQSKRIAGIKRARGIVQKNQRESGKNDRGNRGEIQEEIEQLIDELFGDELHIPDTDLDWDVDKLRVSHINKERSNTGGSERVFGRELRNGESGQRNFADKKRGELDDTIRAKIDKTVRDTTESFYTRITEDSFNIRKEYERSQSRDSEAERDVGEIWEYIKELADKHQSRTAGGIREQVEREGTMLYQADSELKAGINQCSNIYRKFGDRIEESTLTIKRVALRIVKIIGERIRELKDSYHSMSMIR